MSEKRFFYANQRMRKSYKPECSDFWEVDDWIQEAESWKSTALTLAIKNGRVKEVSEKMHRFLQGQKADSLDSEAKAESKVEAKPSAQVEAKPSAQDETKESESDDSDSQEGADEASKPSGEKKRRGRPRKNG